MASISSLGVGSKLDLTGLLDQLATAEKQPLLALNARAASYTTKLSAYGKLQSSVGAFQTAAAKLSSLDFFQGVKVSSSFTTVVTANAASNAVVGSHAINITQLAQAQTLASQGQASATATIGSGAATISIGFGTFVPSVVDAGTGLPTTPSFTVNPDKKPASIAIAADSSLEDIRDAVNAANAGVSASIVNDGSGTPYRLVLVSSDTGEASSMKISVSGNAAMGTLLDHNPVSPQNMTETAAAKDAKLTVDGLAVTSPTNTVKESMQGVTLTLVKPGDSTLTVSRDTASMTSAINAFVSAYNSLLSTGKELTSYDATTNKGAALMGDSTLRNLQLSLRQALTSPQGGAAPGDLTMLSKIGVSFQKDGTLAVDATKLETALSTNLDGVAKLFAGTATDKAGYGKQLSTLALSFTGSGGPLTAAANGVTTTLKQLEDQYDAMETRVNATVERYRKQFTQLDIMMSSMNSTSNYLTAQFDAMNANK
jgi:flagellar hook-associated protein 2